MVAGGTRMFFFLNQNINWSGLLHKVCLWNLHSDKDTVAVCGIQNGYVCRVSDSGKFDIDIVNGNTKIQVCTAPTKFKKKQLKSRKSMACECGCYNDNGKLSVLSKYVAINHIIYVYVQLLHDHLPGCCELYSEVFCVTLVLTRFTVLLSGLMTVGLSFFFF